MTTSLHASPIPVNDDAQFVALLRQRMAAQNLAWFRTQRQVPLGELIEEKHAARDEYERLTEFGPPTDAKGIELAAFLERHIVSLEIQIDAHPDSAWTALECCEEMRLR